MDEKLPKTVMKHAHNVLLNRKLKSQYSQDLRAN